MKLDKLSKIGKKKKRRLGRGYGSGGGHTVGKGQKGQGSRSGYKKMRGWIRESKIRSLPKLRGVGKRKAGRGFFKQKFKSIVLNIKDLDQFQPGETISKDLLLERGVITGKSKNLKVKILGDGDIKKKFMIKGIEVSGAAKKKIEAAGGKVI